MAAPGARATFSLWRGYSGSSPSSSPAETSASRRAAAPLGDQRCGVTGVADRHAVEGRLADGVHDGRGDVALEVADLAVEAVEHLGRVVVVEGVGAQRAAQPAHRHRRPEPVPLDIAHHEADLAAGQREDVVPVAAEVSLGGQVAHRDVEPVDRRRRGRKQAALQGQRRQVRIVLGPLGEALADLAAALPAAPVSSGVKVRGVRHPDVQDAQQALRSRRPGPRGVAGPRSRGGWG